jgi:hypothetical protein
MATHFCADHPLLSMSHIISYTYDLVLTFCTNYRGVPCILSRPTFTGRPDAWLREGRKAAISDRPTPSSALSESRDSISLISRVIYSCCRPGAEAHWNDDADHAKCRRGGRNYYRGSLGRTTHPASGTLAQHFNPDVKPDLNNLGYFVQAYCKGVARCAP